MPTGRMIAFTMALMGCLLIMYKAIWYDQFSCPDGFLLRVRPVDWAPGLGRAVAPCRQSAREGPRGVSCGRTGCLPSSPPSYHQEGWSGVFPALWERDLHRPSSPVTFQVYSSPIFRKIKRKGVLARGFLFL